MPKRMPMKKMGALQRMQAGGVPDEYDDPSQPEDDQDNTDPSDPSYGDDRSVAMDGSGGADAGSYSNIDPNAANAAAMSPFKMMQARQDTALQQLQAAQARATEALRPQKDDRAMWLSVASGLLRPTQTGSFGESVGYGAGNAAPFMQRRADQDADYRKTLSDFDLGLAQDQYTRANKAPSIIDWYARNPAGVVGKQKALLVDGTPVPFGEVFTPQGGGQNGLQAKIDAYAAATGMSKKDVAQKLLNPSRNTSVNVQMGQSFEKESEKNAADYYKTLVDEAGKSRSLAAQLNAIAPEIDKVPKAYFGPAGAGLVAVGKGLNQIGIDVGDGLDSASFVQAITSHLGPAQRIVGSGSSSDRDVALFMNSLPGLTQTKEGNKALIKYYNKLNVYNQKLLQIIRKAGKERSDFYGIDDLSVDEINKAGRAFSDADLADMQKLSGGASAVPPPRVSIPHAVVKEEDDGTLVINPGGQ